MDNLDMMRRRLLRQALTRDQEAWAKAKRKALWRFAYQAFVFVLVGVALWIVCGALRGMPNVKQPSRGVVQGPERPQPLAAE